MARKKIKEVTAEEIEQFYQEEEQPEVQDEGCDNETEKEEA